MIAASDKINIRGLVNQLKQKGYEVYDEPNKLNIVGVRANSTTPNSFDDIIYVFYKDENNQWQGKAYPATTDPGTYWLKNPMNPQGTAILKDGQYVDAYKIGLHRGQYTALVQQRPVIVYRDYDRNAILDWNNRKEDKGLFGINIHRANRTGTTKTIDKNSAGCQVFANADDFNEFITLANKHREKHGNNFTYTLIDERSYIRSQRRMGVYLGIAAIAVSAFVAYRAYNRKPILPNLLDN